MQDTPMTSQDMRIVELNSQYLGITLGMLMQNAGREVAREIVRFENLKGKHIVILCGSGGNGGDGMVAARHLCEAGAIVDVVLLRSERDISSPDTLFNWKLLNNLNDISKHVLKTESSVKRFKPIKEAEILIDGMLGFGLKSSLREPILTSVKVFNKSEARKYAIDVPTGIDSDTGKIQGTAVKADITITLHAPKPGLLNSKEYVGKLIIVPIGIPPEAERICGPGDLWLFTRPRSSQSHKGDFGRILVIGGSDVFSGAPALTGMAALRTGADLVTILTPEPVVSAVRAYSPNLMVRSLGTHILVKESIDSIMELVNSQDVIALGPGLGLAQDTISTVRAVVSHLLEIKKPLVIDADGLKALASSGIHLNSETTVMTPHWGELSILLGRNLGKPDNLEVRIRTAIEAAKLYDSVLLLKGPIDIIAEPNGNYKLNHTGVPAMTVGGTGDVLTGITATLLSRKFGAFQSAAASAFISGQIGEAASAEFGDHIVATDCIKKIPDVMNSKN
jgi:hydroxyethylthiazole kinase-like uncharacterized protein yjeF